MTAEITITEAEEGPSIWDTLRAMFATGSEYADFSEEKVEYQRKMLDYRIEAYLDAHFNEYILDFGLLDEAALEVRNEHLVTLEGRSDGLIHFIRDMDTDLSDLEGRVDTLEKAPKKK
ncbi:TPA: hypothetical protein HA259_03390 [Thermoplasmata archaeon]|nr:hypothetical protein [Thermoplasmata archaeon]